MSFLDGLFKNGTLAADLATNDTQSIVNVDDAAPPKAGEVLTAIDGTHAVWTAPTGGGDPNAPLVRVAKQITTVWADYGAVLNVPGCGIRLDKPEHEGRWVYEGAIAAWNYKGVKGSLLPVVVASPQSSVRTPVPGAAWSGDGGTGFRSSIIYYNATNYQGVEITNPGNTFQLVRFEVVLHVMTLPTIVSLRICCGTMSVAGAGVSSDEAWVRLTKTNAGLT